MVPAIPPKYPRLSQVERHALRSVGCALAASAVLCVASAPALARTTNPAPPAAQSDAGPDPSRDASRIYARAKASIFQVRVLTSAGRSQVAVGSGFVVGVDGLAVTNYHVVSSLVLDPQRFVAQAVGTGGGTDDLEVLKVDVQNDLALIRLKTQRDWPPLPVELRDLNQGERLYSLGNPLDIGFAISEGSFNGVAIRPYYPQILFSGAINRGMSGGPAVDYTGRVVGVNVSKRLDGEQISFLVPARFVTTLVASAGDRRAQPTKDEFASDIAMQLREHQATMTDRLLAAPLALRALGPYRVPVTEAPGIRCWASDSPRPELLYETTRLSCVNQSAPYLQSSLTGAFISVQHDYYSSDRLASMQFLRVYSLGFGKESFGTYKSLHWTEPECTDSFVQRTGGGGVPLRAVLCVRAMRKFEGLYDVALLTATTDDSHRGVITRMRATAVTLENGQRIARAFIDAMERAR